MGPQALPRLGWVLCQGTGCRLAWPRLSRRNSDLFLEAPSILPLGFFGLFDHKACGILAPGLGIEPTSPTLEGKVLTTGSLGEPHPMGVLTVGSEGWDLLRLSSSTPY